MMHHIYDDLYNGKLSEIYANWFIHVHLVPAMFWALPLGSLPWAMSLNVKLHSLWTFSYTTIHLKSHFGNKAILKDIMSFV